MLVFIDESGIHKKVDHSSFAVVYLSLENENFINLKIQEIEKKLGLNYFHWTDFGSKSGWRIRSEFIRQIALLPFSFKYTIATNPINPKQTLFYCLTHLLTERNIKKVCIDGHQPKWYERQIKRTLRSGGLSVKKLRCVSDRTEPALRLADALAGLVRSYHDGGSKTAAELYNFIRSKNKITVQLTVDGQDTR